MQMKRDLMEGRLICAENTGALLVSHLVQGRCLKTSASHSERFEKNLNLIEI